MIYFTKTFNKYNFYLERDFIYKADKKNSHTIMNFNKFIVTQNIVKTDNLLDVLSSFILLFDHYPFIRYLTKTNDNKIKNMPLGLQCQIGCLNFFSIFFRLKNENFMFINKNVENEQQHFHLVFKNNNFDEFITLYEKYQNLLDISINIYFNNCYVKEEKKLLLSSLDLI